MATCRMYTSFDETWSGLMKNASEGFARLPLLPVMTTLMLLAFVAPIIGLAACLVGFVSSNLVIPVFASCVLGYLPRFFCCLKFDRAWLAFLANPISILLFLIIQWIALFRKQLGKGVQWRQRNYEIATS